MLSILGDLWVPIVLATVLTFFAGALLHMVIPIHRHDFGALPDEDGVLAALRKVGLQPGNYLFPCPASPKAMNDPAFVAKMEAGPAGIMTVRPAGRIVMGPPLAKQALFHLVVSFVVAYVASRTLGAGEAYLKVFQVVGTVALLGYIAALFPAAIWYREPRAYVTSHVVDGVVWGLLTAGSFAGFWPA